MKANNKFYIIAITAFLVLCGYFWWNCHRSDEMVLEYSRELAGGVQTEIRGSDILICPKCHSRSARWLNYDYGFKLECVNCGVLEEVK